MDKLTELKLEDLELRLEVKNNELKRVGLRIKQITYDYEQQIEQQKGNQNNIVEMITKLVDEIDQLKGDAP
jgi:hypothetical protein